MFRIWGKIWKDTHLLQDEVVENSKKETRTHKIFQAVEQFCKDFDLSQPIWLDCNIEEFKRRDKTRFSSDNFIDSIDFDYLEIQVLEEDEFYETPSLP